MSRKNPGWGAPRIHGELLKLGIDIGETSVSKYLVRSRKPPSQTWRTFLENHLPSLVSVDFFTVPTIRFQILYVFLVLAHERRRILHFAVTAHPTAEWTAHQHREAFPWDSAPRYLLRDRDRIFGQEFVEQVKAMEIERVLSAPPSPWQRAYIERLIGSIRRECLDHMIVFNERSLKQHLLAYCAYYHRTRTHLALAKDCPEPRAGQNRRNVRSPAAALSRRGAYPRAYPCPKACRSRSRSRPALSWLSNHLRASGCRALTRILSRPD